MQQGKLSIGVGGSTNVAEARSDFRSVWTAGGAGAGAGALAWAASEGGAGVGRVDLGMLSGISRPPRVLTSYGKGMKETASSRCEVTDIPILIVVP